MSTHDEQILAEQALAESRVLLESAPTPATKPLGFFGTLQTLRSRAKCRTCDKTTLVFNAARRGFKAERVTLDSHCSCPGGPAHYLIAAGSGGDITE